MSSDETTGNHERILGWLLKAQHPPPPSRTGPVRAGAQAGMGGEGKKAHFSNSGTFNLSHLERNKHWRPTGKYGDGTEALWEQLWVSLAQSTTTVTKGCEDATTWFCSVKSSRGKHQLSPCTFTRPSGNTSMHLPTQMTLRVPATSTAQLINCSYWDIRSSMWKPWSSKKTREPVRQIYLGNNQNNKKIHLLPQRSYPSPVPAPRGQ